MFHFLQTIKKDAGKVVSNTAKAGHKTLNFLGDVGNEVGSTASAIVMHPKEAAIATGKAIAQPFEDVAKEGQKTIKHLAAPASTQAERDALINNQNAAGKNPEYKKAIKGLDQHGNSVQGVNEAQKMAASGASADEIRTHLKKDAEAKQKQDAKAAGDLAQIASTVTGANTVKDIAEVGKTAKALSTAEKLKTALKTGGKIGAEGTLTGAENSAGTQLSDTGSIDAGKTFKDALTGGVLAETGAVGKDLLRTGTKAAIDKTVKPVHAHFDEAANKLDTQANDVATKHPQVTKYDDQLQSLASHRDSLVKSGASHEAIASADKSYKATLAARDSFIKSVKESGFKDALTGTDNFTSKQLDDMEAAGANSAASRFKSAITTPTEPGYTPPKSGADILNESLPGKARLTPEVTQLLEDTGKAVPKASKTPILEGFRDPQSVASRYFGKEGSDIVYESSQAAKKRSDLQEAANPLITDVEKSAKKLTKTTAGQPEVRRRLNQALEDRANADSYLKTPQEKETYKALQKAYDFGKQLLEEHGIGTLENYSPRIARKNAQNASEGLDYTLNKAFSSKTDSSFTKKRTEEVPTQPLNEDPVEALRGYFSSISKQLAYEPLMKSLPERLQKINPIHTINRNDKETGKLFLQKHFKNLLQPDIPTGGFFGEKFQNKLINQTYRSALKFKPSFILTNPTQRLAARSQVSGEAIRLSKQIDPEDLKGLQEGLTSGKSTISSDLSSSAESVSGKQSKTDILHEKLSGEQGNVVRAFNLGVSQHVASSPIYKAARKAGKSAKEAAKEALADQETKDAAIRDGNVLTNVTQFGANVANKPQVLAEGGTIGVTPLSKKWFQQYKRFQLGTTQLIGNITNPKNARALDIMRRGDPKQTQLVDYLKAAKTLQNAMKEARKTVNAGETNVSHEDLDGAQHMLDRSVKILDKQIKNASQIRGGRTAKNLGLMWAAASTIQFLMQGATNPGKAAEYGSPVSIPTQSDNPLNPNAPSSPIGRYGISKKKLLNFIPVVGPVVNRASEAEKLIEALTGQGK